MLGGIEIEGSNDVGNVGPLLGEVESSSEGSNVGDTLAISLGRAKTVGESVGLTDDFVEGNSDELNEEVYVGSILGRVLAK